MTKVEMTIDSVRQSLLNYGGGCDAKRKVSRTVSSDLRWRATG